MGAVASTRRGPTDRRYRAARRALTAAGVIPTFETTQGSEADRVFRSAVVEAGLTELSHDRWPCEETIKEGGPAILREDDAVVYRFDDGAIVFLSIGWGTLSIRVAAATQDACASALLSFRAAYPATYLVDDGASRVPITFWTLSRFGPTMRMRMIDAQSWGEIEQNYPTEVHAELAHLMDDYKPGTTGQLLLWQGPPGTGKTWALRALASHWRPWAEFHYITDPDSFFVDDPSYMVDVLLSDSYEAVEPTSGMIFDEAKPEGKWRVLILEDTGELLASTAKEKYGQGLSRLLNVVDGMIGQGLRVLCLVTTNDELGELNPAVLRPGRCASQIAFRPFTPVEAEALTDIVWTSDEVTLAEIYAARGAGRDALAEDDGIPDDAHYRPADDQAQSCGTCEYFDDGHCTMFDADVEPDYTCDRWEGEDEETPVDELVAMAMAPLEPDEHLVASMLGDLGLDGRADASALTAALSALASAHRTTVASITSLMQAAVKGREGGKSDALAMTALGVLSQFATRPQPAPAPAPHVTVNVPEREQHVTVEAPRVEPHFSVTVPEQPPANVEVNLGDQHFEIQVPPQEPPHVEVNVPPVETAALQPTFTIQMPEPKPRSVRIEYDDDGNKRYVTE